MSDNDGQESTIANNGNSNTNGWAETGQDSKGWNDGERKSVTPSRDNDEDTRRKSRSLSPRDRDRGNNDNEIIEPENINPGNNLFVTGISTRLSERELEELFAKYGKVEKCSIMCDPHTRESRGFGFVTMEKNEGAQAAIENITGMEVSGRTITVEKAKRARARTPTPGRYHGPPKREDRYPRRGDDRHYDRGYDRGYGGGGDRYDRSGGGGGGYGGGDRYDRGYGRDRYDDRRGGGVGGGGYEDRRGGGGYEDRRGGYGGGGGGTRDYGRRPQREERW